MSGEKNGESWLFPDTVFGTDSHTTMINGIGVLGWGVGGIEAEAAMLGQPSSMLIPQVVGFQLTGRLPEGTTATDLVLTVTQMLRKHGVVGKFVEFFGDGLKHLSLADRATIANMAPEYGATCGIFPIDAEAINYLRLSGRDEAHDQARRAVRESARLVARRQYAARRIQLEARTESRRSEAVAGGAEASAGSRAAERRREELRRIVQDADREPSDANSRKRASPTKAARRRSATTRASTRPASASRATAAISICNDGAVVISAITSCTNTSNPAVMLGAGLLARNAVAKGLKVKPWVKTSLAPGSLVVTDYLKKAGVLGDLEKLGFYLVGYGCTTCIGNSGPLPPEISKGILDGDLAVASVLSGNRNFEGRVHPEVKMNYLASPPLVVAFALAGTVDIDLTTQPLGNGSDGKPVYLKDIWPSNKEIGDVIAKTIGPELFKQNYADVFKGDARWNEIAPPEGERYGWDSKSTYIKNPPYFDGMSMQVGKIRDVQRRARARPVRRFDHHRPHLARRRHQGDLARRPVPAGTRRDQGRFQFVRLAPRQRRHHGARHVRQHPHQESDARRRGRRQHAALPRRRKNCRSTTRR